MNETGQGGPHPDPLPKGEGKGQGMGGPNPYPLPGGEGKGERTGDTVVSCLTPAGTGAIATLAIRGPAAWEVIRRLFLPRGQNRRSLPVVPVRGRRWVGRMGGEAGDEVVLAVREWQPLPWIEVHCHGGIEVVNFLTECFLREGIRKIAWPEFAGVVEDRPFAAEALVALTRAATVRTAEILLDQYQGAFLASIQGILEAWRRGDEHGAGESLRDLAGRCPLGRHLTSSWRVVIAGAPNVGKSSLLNALAGYHRAIVSTISGTTRDLVSVRLAVDGWPVEVTDTAGLRAEAGPLENQGMELARKAIDQADLCFWVLDAGAAPIWPEQPLDTIRVIVNKNDLAPASEPSLALAAPRVSAKTGQGIEALCRQISEWLVPAPPPPGGAVPFTDSICAEIEGCWNLYAEGHRDAAESALEQISSCRRHGNLAR